MVAVMNNAFQVSNPPARIRLTRATFPIKVREVSESEPGTRKGYTWGPFGLHGNKFGYTITHLASGLACGETHGFARAKEAMRAMAGVPGIDWTVKDPVRHAGGVSSEAMVALR